VARESDERRAEGQLDEARSNDDGVGAQGQPGRHLCSELVAPEREVADAGEQQRQAEHDPSDKPRQRRYV
jgi:hypothetical protein